ncbi:hypothetical protein [Haloferax sp. DFSO60]|uniref:hypothetical protein n=1 Tax=Haloferax sp. DFSO60 TaxID=3388652 RepID=UPI00397CE35D
MSVLPRLQRGEHATNPTDPTSAVGGDEEPAGDEKGAEDDGGDTSGDGSRNERSSVVSQQSSEEWRERRGHRRAVVGRLQL